MIVFLVSLITFLILFVLSIVFKYWTLKRFILFCLVFVITTTVGLAVYTNLTGVFDNKDNEVNEEIINYSPYNQDESKEDKPSFSLTLPKISTFYKNDTDKKYLEYKIIFYNGNSKIRKAELVLDIPDNIEFLPEISSENIFVKVDEKKYELEDFGVIGDKKSTSISFKIAPQLDIPIGDYDIFAECNFEYETNEGLDAEVEEKTYLVRILDKEEKESTFVKFFTIVDMIFCAPVLALLAFMYGPFRRHLAMKIKN